METTTHSIQGNNQAPVPPSTNENRLVDVFGLRLAAFDLGAAPSVNTLRSLTRRGILPYFRLGKLIRYDVRLVRAALELHCLVQAKKTGSARKAS